MVFLIARKFVALGMHASSMRCCYISSFLCIDKGIIIRHTETIKTALKTLENFIIFDRINRIL